MTISIKSPTSTTGSIQKNGSDVITIDASDNVTVANDLTVSGTISGTGTSQWSTSGSNISYTTGNVGIGTASPNGLAELRRDAAAPYLVLNRDDDKQWGASISSTGNLAFQYGTTYASMSISTPAMLITSAGEVMIAGTTDRGTYNLQCNGTGVWGQGAYVNGSDKNLKENIKDLPNSLDIVKTLKPVTFTYRQDIDYTTDTNVQIGFIAQDLQESLAGQEYLDNTVQQGPDFLNVAYQNITPLLTKAIQEQQAIIETLTTRIEALEAK